MVLIIDDDDGTLLYRQPFVAPTGPRVPGWRDFEADFAETQQDANFALRDVDGERVLARIGSSGRDVTSYFVGVVEPPLWVNIAFTGRLFVASTLLDDAETGVLILAQVPPGGHQTYGLRRLEAGTFQLFARGTALSGGTIDTGVLPEQNRWYRFRLEAADTGTRTELRARIWLAYDSEPTEWHAEAYDDSAQRIRAGTIGVWSGTARTYLWDDFMVGTLP